MQPHFLADVIVELEGQRLGRFSTSSSRASNSILPEAQVRVGRGTRPRPHEPVHANDELAAQALGFLEHRGGIRIEHHLQQAFAVAQVDENHAAVVAPAMHPAGHRDLLAESFSSTCPQ